jgi:hypothetical protein
VNEKREKGEQEKGLADRTTASHREPMKEDRCRKNRTCSHSRSLLSGREWKGRTGGQESVRALEEKRRVEERTVRRVIVTRPAGLDLHVNVDIDINVGSSVVSSPLLDDVDVLDDGNGSWSRSGLGNALDDLEAVGGLGGSGDGEGEGRGEGDSRNEGEKLHRRSGGGVGEENDAVVEVAESKECGGGSVDVSKEVEERRKKCG